MMRFERCRALVLLILTLTAAGAAQAQSTPTFQGTVTDSGTGQPLAGVAISTSNCLGQPYCAPMTVTDVNGNYTVTASELGGQGNGTLYFQDPGYYYSAAPFTATASTTTINASLVRGGTIVQGTVTDATSGAGIVGASVGYYVYSQDHTTYTYVAVQSTAGGQYAIDSSQFAANMASGLVVSNSYISAPAYLQQNTGYPYPWLPWSPPFPLTQNFTLVSAGDTTPVFQGTVTDSSTGQPLAGVAISTSNCLGQPSCAPMTVTDVDGNYSLTSTQLQGANTGTLYFQDPGYYYSAAPFTATASTTTINASLVRGGTIVQGTVTDATSGAGIVGASVGYYVYSQDHTTYTYVAVQSTAGGQYAIDSSQFAANMASGLVVSNSYISAPAYLQQNTGYPYPWLPWSPPFPLTQNFTLVWNGLTSNVTIATAPAGLGITVDGTAAVAPQTYAWIPGIEHTIATTTPQSGTNGNSLGFVRWSDNGALSHTAVTPNSNVTITATFDGAPVITPQMSGTLGTNGWYTGNVTLTWSVTDSLGTVSSTNGCGPVGVTSDTTGQTYTCSATGLGGSSSQSVTIKRDATPPVASATPTPMPNGNGWNKTSVVVGFSGTDAISGIASCSSSVTLSAQGAHQSASGTCTDNAGNTSATVTASNINIDETPPVGHTAVTPAPNGAGWNNSAVTVNFTASDALSGVSASPCTPSSTVLTTNGAGQTVSSACMDLAGNTSTAMAANINIDTIAPVAVAVAQPAPNANGWNNGPVTVGFVGTDNLGGSGIASCTAAVTLTAQGAGQSASGTCTDVAGNVSAPVADTVNIDTTPPTAVIAVPAKGASYVYGSTVIASYGCADTLSGVASCSGTVGSGTALNTSASGAQSFSITATDKAGNTSTSQVSYTVIVAAPSSLTGASTGSTSVKLNWQASGGAQSYTVSEGTSSSAAAATAIATGVIGTSYSVTGLTPGKTYYFWVQTVHGASLSADSPVATITEPPATPAGLQVVMGNGSVTLKWSASEGAESYQIFQGTTPGGEGATPVQSGITATTATITGLINGQAYYYTVLAQDAGGASGRSAEVSATPVAPSGPATPAAPSGGGGGLGILDDLALIGLAAGLRIARRRQSGELGSDRSAL
jgi:fibronectin type 3 domain-containing protein